MAPPRRVRDETLVLVKPGAKTRTLFQVREERYFEETFLPTQRRFQVSPDARVVAFTRPDTRSLHLVRRDGAEATFAEAGQGDLRFSPDGDMLAVVRKDGDAYRIEQIDLRHFQAKPWTSARMPLITWIEYCDAGLVVQHHDAEQFRPMLSLLPWRGEPEVLVAPELPIQRFTTAKRGTRVSWFVPGEVRQKDGPGAQERTIGDTRGGLVRNAEASPDGRILAFTTGNGLSILEEGKPEVTLSPEDEVHSIWFSRDGNELAWAGPKRAHVRRDGVVRTLDYGDREIATLRFVQGSPGLVLTHGRDVLFWWPEESEVRVLDTMEDEDRSLLGADLFDGGLLLWLGTPWRSVRR